MRVSSSCVLPVLCLVAAGLGQANPDGDVLTGLAGIKARAQTQHTIGIANVKADPSISASPFAWTALGSQAILWPTTSIAKEHPVELQTDRDGNADPGPVLTAAAQAARVWTMTSSLVPTVYTAYLTVSSTVGTSTIRVTRSSVLPSVFTKYFITRVPLHSVSTSTSTVFVDKPTGASTSTVFVDAPTTSSTSRPASTGTRRRTRTTTLQTTLSSTSTVWALSPTEPSSTQTLVIVHDPTSSPTSSSTVVYVVTPVVNSTSTIVKTVPTATLVLTPSSASSLSVTASTSTLWVEPTTSASAGSSSSSTPSSTGGSSPSAPLSTGISSLSTSFSTVTVGPEPSTSPVVVITVTSDSSPPATTATGDRPRITITLSKTTTMPAVTPPTTTSTLQVTVSTSTLLVDPSGSIVTEEPTTSLPTEETATATSDMSLTTTITLPHGTTQQSLTSRPWDSTHTGSKTGLVTRPGSITVTKQPSSPSTDVSTASGTSTTTWTTSTILTSTTTMTSVSTGTSTTTWTSTETLGREGSAGKSSTDSSAQVSTPALQPNVYSTRTPAANANERLNPGTNNRPLGKVKGTLGDKGVTYPNKHGSADCKKLGKKCKVADGQPVRPCLQVLQEHIYAIHVKQPDRVYEAREKIACAPDSTEYCAYIEWEPWTPKDLRHSKVLNEMQQVAIEDGKIPILAIVEAFNWIKHGGAKLCGQTLVPVAEARIAGNGTTAMQVGRYVLKLNVKEQGLKEVDQEGEQ